MRKKRRLCKSNNPSRVSYDVSENDRCDCPTGATTIAKRLFRMNRYTIVVLIALVSAGIFPVIKLFLIPIILAATFATLFFPLYQKILKLFRYNRPTGSLATCIVLFLCIVVPLYVVMHLVVLELIHFYQLFEPMLKQAVRHENTIGFLKYIKGIVPEEIVKNIDINLSNIVNGSAKSMLSIISKVINKTSTNFLEFFATFAITFFTMFYFFIDGKSLLKKIRYLSPMKNKYVDMIFSRFVLISHATVTGTLLVGCIQGIMGALTLLVAGIETWLLWGFLMILLSIIPLVGAWIVLIPAAIIQLLNGQIWQGIFILVVSVVAVSNIDNFLRPRFVGKEAKLHDLVIFFSSLGGIAAFGPAGFIVGPVVAAMFVSVLDIYSQEFKGELKEAERDQV